MIVKVGDAPILKSADLLEQIGMRRPGDKVQVTVNREGKEMSYDVTLANQKGSKKLVARDNQDILDAMGATFETLSKDKAKELGIDGGVVVKDLSAGILKSETGIQDGFIITGINKEKITSVDELRKALNHQKGGVMLEGTYENYPGELFFAFGLPN